MRVRVCAWPDISNSRRELHDEEGRILLDEERLGPIHEVDSVTSEMTEELVEEFEQLNPDFRYNHIEVRIVSL